MILLVIDNLAYRLNAAGELECAPIFGVQVDEWMAVPTVALRTPRQSAMLVQIKAGLEAAESSQM